MNINGAINITHINRIITGLGIDVQHIGLGIDVNGIRTGTGIYDCIFFEAAGRSTMGVIDVEGIATTTQRDN